MGAFMDMGRTLWVGDGTAVAHPLFRFTFSDSIVWWKVTPTGECTHLYQASWLGFRGMPTRSNQRSDDRATVHHKGNGRPPPVDAPMCGVHLRIGCTFRGWATALLPSTQRPPVSVDARVHSWVEAERAEGGRRHCRRPPSIDSPSPAASLGGGLPLLVNARGRTVCVRMRYDLLAVWAVSSAW